MPLHRRAPRFFLFFLITFGAALGAWPVVADAYGALFRAAGGVLAMGTGPWTAQYSRNLEEDPYHDTQLLLLNRESNLRRNVGLSSRRMAYMPTAFLLALVVATPIPWVCKRIVLLWSLLALHVYFAVRLWLLPFTFIAEKGTESEPTILRTLDWILSGSAAGWMIFPLIFWLVYVVAYGMPLAHREERWSQARDQ